MKKLTSNCLALLAALASSATLATQISVPLPAGVTPKLPSAPPGLYVSVLDGAITLANKGGATTFAAGQFGYTATITQPPSPLPRAPVALLTPPPTFLPSMGSNGAATGNKPAPIDCVVR